MEHLVAKAMVGEVTELGEFEAIAAAYPVDAGNEQIARGAFKATLEAWRGRGRQVPLHWDHQGEASNVIGTVDPRSMEETARGLHVKGAARHRRVRDRPRGVEAGPEGRGRTQLRLRHGSRPCSERWRQGLGPGQPL